MTMRAPRMRSVLAARPLRVLACMLAIAALAAGCVTVDSTLDADGSGSIEYTYPVPPNATVDTEKARFTSPHVTVESLTLRPDKTGLLKAKFDDATKLDTAEGFKLATVSRSRDGDDEVLHVTLTNPHPDPDAKSTEFSDMHIAINLPGKVVEATPKAAVEGNRVTWTVKVLDFLRAPKTELTVKYAAAAKSAH